MSDNFRALYTLNHNLNCKQQKKAEELWPLSAIDKNSASNMSADEMYSRNKRIIEAMEKN